MDLTNHTFAELKKIAKTHHLAYYIHLNKSQLKLYIQLTFSQIYKTCCICLNDELHTIKCSRCSGVTCTKCDEQIKLCPLCRLPNPNKLTNLTVLFVDETRQKKVFSNPKKFVFDSHDFIIFEKYNYFMQIKCLKHS